MHVSVRQAAAEYVAHGWVLVPLKADKRPARSGWNERSECLNWIEDVAVSNGEGIGLAHAYSGTACIDIDDWSAAATWFAARGVDLNALWTAPDAVKILSDRPGRGKLLYRIKTPIRTVKPVPGLELRCGNARGTTVQDVLPPSVHPVTGKPYRWEGNWRDLPALPVSVRVVWIGDIDAEPAVEAKVSATPPLGLSDDEIRARLAHVDCDDYDRWIGVGMGLHHERNGDESGLSLWDAWSHGSEKYPGHEELERRWASFGHGDIERTLRSVLPNIAELDEFGEVDPDEPEPEEKFRLYHADEIAGREPLKWHVKGVIPMSELIVMYGPPGSGKSFCAFDLASHIANGQPWRGRRVRQGKVIYIAAEGEAGFTLRVRAWQKHWGLSLDDMLFVVRAPSLLSSEDLAQLCTSIEKSGGADFVVVDTLARTMAGGDENTSEDMGSAISGCKYLTRRLGATVMLVHHSGKDVTKGARGHSSLKGAADTELEVAREEVGRCLTVGKQKDGEDGVQFWFDLKKVELGNDADGDVMNSLVVEEMAQPEVVRKPGDSGQMVMQAIDATTDYTTEFAKLDDVFEYVREYGIWSPDEDAKKRNKSIKAVLQKLEKDGFIEVFSDTVRRAARG